MDSAVYFNAIDFLDAVIATVTRLFAAWAVAALPCSVGCASP
jgi:hypothetical protein